MSDVKFQPFIPDEAKIPEFTVKSILMGALFGIIFGASTVYLALKAGLTVSASIPIAVIAITLGRRLLKTTILENNIIMACPSIKINPCGCGSRRITSTNCVNEFYFSIS